MSMSDTRRYRHLVWALLAVLSLLLPARAAQGPEPTYQSHLARFQKCAARVGIEVASLSSGKVVWEHHSADPLIPASLVKVLTSYAALKALGPYEHFSTTIWASAEPQGDTIVGPIWVKSEGDIFLPAEKAWTLARQLKDRGVLHIRGGIVVDNSYFEPQTEQICLDDKCGESYNPILSATAMEFNTMTLRVLPAEKPGSPLQVTWLPPGDYVQVINLSKTGPKKSKAHLKIQSSGLTQDGKEKFQVSGTLPAGTARTYEYRFNIEDPASFFSCSFKALLQQTGIEIQGPVGKSGKAPAGAKKLATYESPPLGDLLYGLNRFSNNFMAEMLLRGLGARVLGPPGTVGKGVAVIRKELAGLDISERDVALDSGSGLSRGCRVSPQAFCRVLVAAYRDFSIGPEFLSSLAMNAQEGTLKRRLHQTTVTVRGKTGTLKDVAGFAGYVTGPGKDIYAVTILLNEVQNLWEAREAIDSFLESLPALR